MNKLVMMATVLVAAASASAQDVWDYKASVKNVYLKQISVQDTVLNRRVSVYVKTVASTSLKGYLIQDANSRGWLVVLNPGAQPSSYATPRIMPARLMTKVWDPTLKAWNRANGKLSAEGYLAVGAVPIWSQNAVDAPDYSFLNANDDWDYTSAYLFGRFNQPATDDPFPLNPANYQNISPSVGFWWWETWMNHAGTGTAVFSFEADVCCGRVAANGQFCVDTLSGYLKGGLYLCSTTGYTTDHTWSFEGIGWEMGPFDGWETTTNVRGDLGVMDSLQTDVLYGTWSIKYNTKLPPNSIGLPAWAEAAPGVALNANIAMVNAAIKALKPGAAFNRVNDVVALPTQVSNPIGTVSQKFAVASGL